MKRHLPKHRTAPRLILFLYLLCTLGTGGTLAQDFSVRSFRMLPNDITAYIAPVRDLNDEACALVKVVGDKDFAFSSPLGIAKRKNDVGEIWIYLPKGSVMLTIKHPQWGVWRDYRFPQPLESRMTYELVLASPVGHSQPKKLPPLTLRPPKLDTSMSQAVTLPDPSPRIYRPHERIHYLGLLNVGFRQGHPSAGLRLALMRRHGAYLLGQTDFRSTPGTQGECDSEGRMDDGTTPYYSGRTKEGRWTLMAGGIHRLIGECCLYEGVGYGRRTTVWQRYDGSWLRNKDYTCRGLCAEVGGLYRFQRIAISVGVLTIQGKYWEGTVGVGIHF